jgi:hypothetical protein
VVLIELLEIWPLVACSGIAGTLRPAEPLEALIGTPKVANSPQLGFEVTLPGEGKPP